MPSNAPSGSTISSQTLQSINTGLSTINYDS
jgi:hypothetical protein